MTQPGDLVASERDVLLHYLNKNRDAVVRITEGLSEEQLRRPGVPSGTNLLGLIYHLVDDEVHWLQRVFLGADVESDDAFEAPAGASPEAVIAMYRAACARSDQIVRECPDLSTLARIANPGEAEPVALRRIVTHMIEETARHAGHADILREQIDGITGR